MASSKPEDVVSVELITDFNLIQEKTGLIVKDNFLYTLLGLDSCRDVAPTLARTSANKYYLIAKQIEKGNLSENGRAYNTISKRDIDMIYHGPYFTWEGIQEAADPPPSTQAQALSEALTVDKVTVHKDMSLGRYQEYKDVFQVDIDPGEKKRVKISVYAVDKKGMASAYDKDRAEAQKAALELIDKFSKAKSEDNELIKENISISRSDKLALLDSLMSKDNLSSVLASSPINIQELAPLPWDELKDGYLALYHGQQAFLLSPEPVENPLLTKKGDYDSLRDALDELIDDASLGVEEKNLDIGRVSEIGWDKVKNATDLFRTWREHSTFSDLPYYVIVGQATRYAMEKAVAFAGEAIAAKQKIAEKDIEEKFLGLVNEFKLKYNCSSFDFKRYFVVLHAGTRTPYASLSSDYSLSPEMNSLKLDAGILIFHNGILRGCSDMARSLVLTEEGKKIYDLTERLMLESAIPAAKPGNTGSDVYWAGVSPLVELEDEIKKWGMLPPAASIKDSYNRDIGHIMAKQEPATIGLVKAETNRRLQAGMIGAVEYQWPYKKHALGIEDLYLVTDNKGIVISR